MLDLLVLIAFRKFFYGEWAKLAEQAHNMNLFIYSAKACKDFKRRVEEEEILRVWDSGPVRLFDSKIILQPPHYLREMCDATAIFCKHLLNIWWVAPFDIMRILLSHSPEPLEGLFMEDPPAFYIEVGMIYPGEDVERGRTFQRYLWKQYIKLPVLFDGSTSQELITSMLDEVSWSLIKEFLELSKEYDGRPWQRSLKERARIEAEDTEEDGDG